MTNFEINLCNRRSNFGLWNSGSELLKIFNFCGNYKNPNSWSIGCNTSMQPVCNQYATSMQPVCNQYATLVCNTRYIFAPMSSKLCLCVYSNWFKLRENTWKYVDWELRWNYRDVLVKLRAYSTLFWTASCIIWFIRSKVKPL